MASFKRSHGPLIRREGGYTVVDDPDDPGGLTYAGISQKSHPDALDWQAIRAGEFPSNRKVDAFYRAEYWDRLHLFDVAQPVADQVYWLAVHSGVRTARRLFAEARTVDSDPAQRMVALIRDRACDRYRRIANKRPKSRKYLRGWLNRVFE